jgi:hypothetical protein
MKPLSGRPRLGVLHILPILSIFSRDARVDRPARISYRLLENLLLAASAGCCAPLYRKFLESVSLPDLSAFQERAARWSYRRPLDEVWISLMDVVSQ